MLSVSQESVFTEEIFLSFSACFLRAEKKENMIIMGKHGVDSQVLTPSIMSSLSASVVLSSARTKSSENIKFTKLSCELANNNWKLGVDTNKSFCIKVFVCCFASKLFFLSDPRQLLSPPHLLYKSTRRSLSILSLISVVPSEPWSLLETRPSPFL